MRTEKKGGKEKSTKVRVYIDLTTTKHKMERSEITNH